MNDLCHMWGSRAESGDAEAQFQLGYCYEMGHGTMRNISVATEWYLRAAQQGHSRAQLHIGLAFSNGVGVDWDLAEACKWLTLAAQRKVQGAQDALNMLKMPADARTLGEQRAKLFKKIAEPEKPLPPEYPNPQPLPPASTTQEQLGFDL
ncbi:MAG: sel1 repeat family protein [Verrucomicrobia bacterium]|nr:sel1 repeat family protein [Verrucomicrobiota bacterium]